MTLAVYLFLHLKLDVPNWRFVKLHYKTSHNILTTIKWMEEIKKIGTTITRIILWWFHSREKCSLQCFQKLRGEWREAKSARGTAVFGNSREAEEGLYLHWIRPSVGQGLRHTSDSDRSTNSCLTPEIQGQILWHLQITDWHSCICKRTECLTHNSPDKNTVSVIIILTVHQICPYPPAEGYFKTS